MNEIHIDVSTPSVGTIRKLLLVISLCRTISDLTAARESAKTSPA
jgi:hypothetical protein